MGHLMAKQIGQKEGGGLGWIQKVPVLVILLDIDLISGAHHNPLCFPNTDAHESQETITLGKAFPKGEGRIYDSAETHRILTNLQPPSVSALYPSLNNTAARLERGNLSKKEMKVPCDLKQHYLVAGSHIGTCALRTQNKIDDSIKS